MHHGIFPPWAEMQLEWDAAVRCDCVQMNLSALAPGAWVRPCDAHCLRWLSVQKRRGQVRGAHSPHKVAHLLSCDKCNQCRRSPRYFKWIRLPLKIDGGKLAKTSCHCWHKQEMGCCHYRNIQVKDRACKKRGKNVSCTIKWPWRSRNVGNAFREGLGWKRSVQGLLPPPTAATVGCNTEIYEGIMENNHWWEPRALCCTEKRSFRSKQHQPPVLTLECPPLIYQDSIFSCTWNSNGFMGINNDSCEANIRDFRGSINAGGIQPVNSPIIHNISHTA